MTQKVRRSSAALLAAAVLGGAGVAFALIISDDRTIFCSEFVPNAQAESNYVKWTNQNPGDRDRWVTFRNAICAGGNPTPPVMLSAKGKGLVAAGKMALPEEPPPTTTTTTTTPPPVAQCSNGVNDDAPEDALIDFPSDPGCTSASDPTESPNPPPPPSAQCSNGINDDPSEDALVDFPADPGCTSATDTSESPNPPPPPGSPTLQQVDGGPGYFGQFANPLPSSFPITAWIRPVHDQTQVNQYKDFGLNLFTGLENPELTNEALLRSNGLKALILASERTRFNDLGSETAGWVGGDEIDMSAGGEFKCLNGQFQQGLANLGIGVNGIANDNRMVHYNFGKGLGIWYREGFRTDEQNRCYVNHPFLDIVTVDVYYNTDMATGQWHRRGWAYGADVTQLRTWDAFDGMRKPVGITVELGPPGSGETFAPQPAEVRSAVWHSIIAGARVVQYFDHNFGTSTNPPTCHGSTIRGQCFPLIRAMAKATNEQIQSLAPVIHSPFVTSGWTLTGATTKGMVKWDGSSFYVFLGTHDGGNATFSMPCVGNAAAVRLAPSNLPAEAASIPVSGGSFTDTFADKNAVHIYRIDGGSTCGL